MAIHVSKNGILTNSFPASTARNCKPRSITWRNRSRPLKACAANSNRISMRDQFLEVVRASEATTRIVNRIYAFAGLSFAADTQDQNAQSLMGRVQQFVAEMQNRTLFFSLWWKDLDDENAERLMDPFGRLSLLSRRDAPLQAAYVERSGREDRQSQGCDGLQAR